MQVKAWKQILVGATASLCVLGFGFWNGSAGVQAATAGNAVPTVYVDGEQMHFDVQPLIYQNRTLVPMRMIFEAMGASVTFDNASQTVVASENGTTIRMPIGKKVAYVNGNAVSLDVPPQLINARTMVPVRFISDTFGNELDWNQQELVVQIVTHGAPQVRVIGADRYVKDGQAQGLADLIQSQNFAQLVQNEVGLTYNKPIWMYIVGSDAGYQQAATTYGDPSEAASIAANSDGVAIGSHIIIPLEKQPTDTATQMTVAHEMMHVLLNQNGGSTLPGWVHEGLAWETGLDVSLRNSPAIMREHWEGTIRDDVLNAVVKNEYQPLLGSLAGESDALGQASYNLEFQDYLAYRDLVNQFGKDTFNTYIKRYTQDESDAFDKTFGLSEQTFETQFHQSLVTDSQKTDSGVQVTLQVPAGYNGTFTVLPQNSNTWRTVTLLPGTDTIRIYKNGTIEGAPVVDTNSDNGPQDAATVYLFTEPQSSTTDQGYQTDGGGLAVYESFGQYVFSNVWLHTTSDQTKYPDSNKVLGIELTDVQAIQ